MKVFITSFLTCLIVFGFIFLPLCAGKLAVKYLPFLDAPSHISEYWPLGLGAILVATAAFIFIGVIYVGIEMAIYGDN